MNYGQNTTGSLAGIVVTLTSPHGESMPGHEAATQTDVATSIANIQGVGFAGAYDAHRTYEGRLFFVPDDVLLDVQARQLGITSDGDLFGGVVPHDFVKTK